jgi:predicted outer membrane repeat protein
VPSPTAQTDGAGAFIDSGSPVFIRCVFSHNTILPYTDVGAGGAGVAMRNSSATFQECTFEENLAIGYDGYGYGGAVLICEGAPQFTTCTFQNNSVGGAGCAGGAVASTLSDFVLTECTFVGNHAIYAADTVRAMNSAGGAVYCIEHGHPTMADCLFEGNSASEGGAVHLDGDGEATVIGCTFLANEATDIGRGGAVYNSSNCTGNLDGCRFLGNTANGWGGALYAKGAPTVVSCLFSGNSAVRGAGIYAEIYALPVVVNCTFSNNVAAEEGGAFCSIVGTTRFSNCILWGNAPQEIRSDTGGLQIDHSDVQGLGLSSQGNIDANPRFQDPLGADAIAGTLDDDLRLSAGSPCLDAGDDAALPAFATTDLDGLERVVGGRVDMGAYEFSGPLRYYVDAATGDDDNGGWGPREAFATIQRGIRAASEGYTVLVMPGVYTEEINFAGKAITVSGENGGAILEAPGGYAVSCYTAERSTSVLKNFVVRNSDVGIFVAGAMPTIRNVTVTGNEFGIASYAGGNPDISNCILWDNIDGDLFGCTATYSCVQQGVEGEGNIREDPLFADPEAGDYHLLSERGRFVPAHALWAFDTRTSPCVDTGDPKLDPGAERMPNGGRINMGAFGGTPQASMSEWPLAGDLNRDRRVDFADLAILLDQWLEELPAVSAGATDTSSLQPNPARWAIDGQPREVHGGGGVFDYYVEMTAAEVVSLYGPVEYFFDCRQLSGYDSGWQTARTHKVLVGRSSQGLEFRVRARDQAGNMTDWSEWAIALPAS